MEIVLHKPQSAGEWMRLFHLYRSAFPRAERKPFGTIRRLYSEGKADVWCVLKNGRFSGLATTINGDGLILLDYFAVVKRSRGQGIGREAMACLLELYRDQGVFLEIEDPKAPGLHRQIREKRKEFYLSCGFSELGVRAKVFGVRMELLGVRCNLDFAGFRAFYGKNMSPWAADHLEEYK